MLTTDQLIGSGLAILSAFMHAADGVMGTVQKYLADVRLFSDFLPFSKLEHFTISRNEL